MFKIWIILFLIPGAISGSTPYERAVERLLGIQHFYSSISEVFSIGKNDDEVPILAIRISNNPKIIDKKNSGYIDW